MTLDMESFERFKKTYGSLPFVCRFRNCPRGLEGFVTLKQREQHEAVHYRRWNCGDTKCLFYARGWRSARALVQHNQMYHIKPQAFPSWEGKVEPAKSTEKQLAVAKGIREDNPQSKEEYVCSGVLPSGETWGCGQGFVNAAALKAHFRTTVGFECIKELYGETAGPVDQDDLQPRKRKYVFSNECLGTLNSGAQWECGKDFDTEASLFKHWQSDPGRECRKALHDEVETKMEAWGSHGSKWSAQVTKSIGLTSFPSKTGLFQQNTPDRSNDTQDATPQSSSDWRKENVRPEDYRTLLPGQQQLTPQEYSRIKNTNEPGDPEWESFIQLFTHGYATEPEPKAELPYLPETSFFDESLD